MTNNSEGKSIFIQEGYQPAQSIEKGYQPSGASGAQNGYAPNSVGETATAPSNPPTSGSAESKND